MQFPYENMVYYKPVLYAILFLFLWTILKQIFLYFKPIILKQKIAKNSLDLCNKNFCKLALK